MMIMPMIHFVTLALMAISGRLGTRVGVAIAGLSAVANVGALVRLPREIDPPGGIDFEDYGCLLLLVVGFVALGFAIVAFVNSAIRDRAYRPVWPGRRALIGLGVLEAIGIAAFVGWEVL